MTVVRVTPLFALGIFLDAERLVRLPVCPDLDVRQTLAMAIAWMRGLRACGNRMLAELAGRQDGRLGVLRSREHERAEERDHS